MTDAFLSYAREDQNFARRLRDRLVAHGREVWVDWSDIPPTAKWRAEIDAAIEAADVFVFVISPDSLASPICREEIGHAAECNKRFVPILHREVEGDDTPPAISEHNWIFVRETDDFEEGVNEVMRSSGTDLESVRTHTRLLVRAAEWEAAGNDRSLTLRGRDLEAAERWLGTSQEGSGPEPTLLHTRYVVESRRAASRGQRARLVVLGVGLILMAGLTTFALVQRSQAVSQREEAEMQTRIAQSREISSSALSQVETDPDLALLLAREAVRRARTDQAAGALRETLSRYNLVSEFPHGDVSGEAEYPYQHALYAVAMSPQGELVVTKSADGGVILWRRRLAEPPEVLIPSGDAEVFWIEGPMADVAFSPDGSRIAVAAPREVFLFSPDGGERTALEGRGHPWNVAFSPDGSLVASGLGGRVRLWDVASGSHLRDLGTGGSGRMVAFSPDGRFLVTSYGWTRQDDGDVLTSGAGANAIGFVFDVSTGRLLHRLTGHRGSVSSAFFSPDGRSIVTATAGGEAHVWDAETGRLTALFRPNGGMLTTARFDPGGRRIVTASLDGTARIFDSRTGKQIRVLRGHDGQVLDARFSPDGLTVLTSSTDGTSRVWDAASGAPLFVLPAESGAVLTATFDDDGDRVLVAGEDGVARLWDVGDPASVSVLKGHTGPLTAVGFAPGLQVAFTEGGDDSVRVWNPIVGRELFEPIFQLFPNSTAFSADGTRLLTAGSGMDSTIHIWGIPGGEELAEIDTFAPPARAGHLMASINPDGRSFATADVGVSARGAAVWSVATREPTAVLEHETDVLWTTFAPGGDVVVTGNADGSVRLWDAVSGRENAILCCHDGAVQSIVFSPDGRRLVSLARRNVRIWDVEEHRLLASIPHLEDVAAVIISPGGEVVATASGRVVRLWDAGSGSIVGELRGHVAEVTDLAFEPRGSLLATASADRTSRVWTIRGELVTTLHGHADAVTGVAFSDDGSMLATSSADGTARIYPAEYFLPLHRLVRLVEIRAPRSLTTEELQQFVPPAP